QELDQLVRPGAADDAVRGQPVTPGDRGPQLARAAVGVAVQLAGEGTIGLDRTGACTERTLVRRQPDRPLATRLALAAAIGADRQDSGPGLRFRDGFGRDNGHDTLPFLVVRPTVS